MKIQVESKTKTRVWVVEKGQMRSRTDQLPPKNPWKFASPPQRTVAITMRTPGADFELAAGFLYSEGVVTNREDIQHLSYCVDSSIDGEQRYNIVNVALKENLNPDLQPLERHFSHQSLVIRYLSKSPITLNVMLNATEWSEASCEMFRFAQHDNLAFLIGAKC